MCELIVNKDAKGNIKNAILKNFTALYVMAGDRKNPIYDQRDLPKSKQTLFEQGLQAIVTEEVADQIEELFPKASIKKFASKEKLLEKNKIDDPSLVPDMKKYFVVKFVQKLQDRDGNDKPVNLRLKVFKMGDGKATEITHSEAVGNGSVCDLMLSVSNTKTYGTFCYPSILKVTEHVEFAGGNKSLNEFLGDVEVETETVDEQKPKAADEFDEVTNDASDDSPFDDDDY